MDKPTCPLCERDLLRPSDHHLVPKSRGGKDTLAICVDCHRAIHARFDNRQLETVYNSVEALLADKELRGTIKFISKQPATRIITTTTSKSKKRRR